MNAFVIGATGYIGSRVAQALRRAGYRVTGLTRHQDKRGYLARNEIIPLVGDMGDPESYLAAVEAADVVVHAAADYAGDTPRLDRMAVETVLGAAPPEAGRRTFIYTSGVWVHGNTGTMPATEESPLRPAAMVGWRPETEAMVLAARDVNGLVIRPGCVYGGRGGIPGTWFQQAYAGRDLKPVGDGSNHWALVHVDDLAEAYIAALHADVSGEAFIVADASTYTVRELVSAAAQAAGYEAQVGWVPLPEATRKLGPFAEALTLDQRVDAAKALQMLRWVPRHATFVDEVELYFEAWKARYEETQPTAAE